MMKCFVAVLACAILVAVGALSVLPMDAQAKTVFRKITLKTSTLHIKNGYWIECRYSGLGQICETVYARAKDGNFKPVTANAGKPKRANGWVEICYNGENNAVICYTVYNRVKLKS